MRHPTPEAPEIGFPLRSPGFTWVCHGGWLWRAPGGGGPEGPSANFRAGFQLWAFGAGRDAKFRLRNFACRGGTQNFETEVLCPRGAKPPWTQIFEGEILRPARPRRPKVENRPENLRQGPSGTGLWAASRSDPHLDGPWIPRDLRGFTGITNSFQIHQNPCKTLINLV